MDTELRTNLRRNLIDNLFEFASPAMQGLWVTGHPEIIVTFTETMCGWFDDLFGVGGLQGAVKAGWLTEQESQALRDFHEIAGAYKSPGNDADVLGDANWDAVVRHAQKAWKALRGIVTDGAELQRMDACETRWGAVSP